MQLLYNKNRILTRSKAAGDKEQGRLVLEFQAERARTTERKEELKKCKSRTRQLDSLAAVKALQIVNLASNVLKCLKSIDVFYQD